jgi:hypothetical protein
VGPLFTAVWAYLILEQKTTGAPLACLAVTLAGTALASWQEPTFSTLTFCLMVTINATLTFRNAVTKKVILAFQQQQLQQQAGCEGKEAPTSPTSSKQAQAGVLGSSDQQAGWASVTTKGATDANGFLGPSVMSCLLLALTNLAGLAGVAFLWALRTFCTSAAAWVTWAGEGGGSPSWAVRNIADAVMLPAGAWSLLFALGVCNLM